ncbi:hypothetical protein BH20ACI3_BH20ACI3_38920 [soil metagenome]
MKTQRRWFLAVSIVTLGMVLAMTIGSRRVDGKADHVRWDIISLALTSPLVTQNPGGEAFAFAYHTPGNPSLAKIRLTGAGTFVAPASGGSSGAVTGGGTWETSGPGLPESSGTYRVTKLVSWVFANLQSGAFIDNIGDTAERANGTAVLLIEYNDGSKGMLGIGCHGPGAPNGILEGVIATKGFVTYWNGELPTPGVDKNRTIFHVRQ